MRRSAAVLVLLLAACAAPRPPPSSEQPLFALRSGFWVNLHQRLFADSGPRPPKEGGALFTLRADPRWQRAVEAYRSGIPERGFMTLLEDPKVRSMQRWAAALDDGKGAPGDADPALVAAVREAAKAYRGEPWELDDGANRAWIDDVSPRVARHGAALARAVEAALAAPWPDRPVRVDVTAYAGPTGAFTVLGPLHTTVSSHDERDRGDGGLEILFHEASHGMAEPLAGAIERASRAAGRDAPPQLWHAALFFAGGAVIRGELGSSYVPYAERQGVYQRGPGWSAYRKALEGWAPQRDGNQLDAAMAKVVAALPPQ